MKSFDPLLFTKAPKQIKKSQLIQAPIETVWNVVADHQGMTQWMPMISKVDIQPNHQGEFGEGCERQCQFGPDLLNEKIVHWDPPYSYAYMISDMHLVRDHLGHLLLSEQAPDTTLITWVQYFKGNGNVFNNFIAKNIMMPTVMARGLKNLRKKVA